RRENLVKSCAGSFLIALLGESKLADEDLTCLVEHALLACRKALVGVATAEVANNFRDANNVTRSKLFDICLETTRPVGRLFDIGLAQNGEHALEALLVDDITHANEVHVFGRDLDDQVSLRHAQLKISLLFALDGALEDVLAGRRTAVRVDDGITVAELPVCGAPLHMLPRFTIWIYGIALAPLVTL